MRKGGRMLERKKKLFWTALTLLYLMFIYSNSMRTAPESAIQSRGFLRLIEKLFPFMIYNLGLTEHILRKTAHYGEYLVLGVLLAQVIKTYGFLRMRQFWTVLISGFLMAAGDEGIQLFTEGRSGQFSDVMLDLCGVITGLSVWRLVKFLKKIT